MNYFKNDILRKLSYLFLGGILYEDSGRVSWLQR